MTRAEDIQKLIANHMPEATVVVEDPLNDGLHLRAVITSPEFAGKSRIEQHRMVYAALGQAFEGPLHALQLKTQTPDQAKA